MGRCTGPVQTSYTSNEDRARHASTKLGDALLLRVLTSTVAGSVDMRRR